MKKPTRINIGLMGLAVITSMTGCAVSQAPKYTDFGETYQHAQDLTTVTDPAQAKGHAQDGQLMRNVLESHRKDIGEPQEVEKTLSPGTGGK